MRGKPSHPDSPLAASDWQLLSASDYLGFLICLGVFNTRVTYLERREVWRLVVCLSSGLDVACGASHELINSCLRMLVTHL